MNRNLLMGLGVAALAAVALIANSVFVVGQGQQAVLLHLGQARAVNPYGQNDAGLKLKTPFIDSVAIFDKRDQSLDAGSQEVIAADQQRLEVDSLVRYQIVDPVAFYKAVGADDVAAHDRLGQIVGAAVRQTAGTASLTDIVSTRQGALTARARDTAEAQARAARLGVRIIDVSFETVGLPDAVRDAVYLRMKTGLEQQAALVRASGEADQGQIEADADRQRDIILATAHAESERVRGEGDAKRATIFAQSFGRDPKFAAFYRAMQAYEGALGQGDTTLVLSPDSEFFKYFKKGPGG